MNENNLNNNNGYPEGDHADERNIQTSEPVNNLQPENASSPYFTHTGNTSEDIRSASNSSYIDPYNKIPQNNIQNSVYQPYVSQFKYSNQYGAQPENVQTHFEESPNPVPVQKKTSNGKKIALIACAIALTMCVGIGGGFLGSYLANNGTGVNLPAYSETSNTSKNNDEKDGAITILQASDTDIKPTTTQEVAQKVKDAVVEITTEITQYDTFYGQYIASSAGSGVIISSDGYIITNNHVIEDATKVNIRLTNGETYEAKLIGRDETLDVALLKIDAKDLTVVTFGDSSKLQVGQTAIAVGNPLGRLGGTVTDGIISALDREIKIDNKTMNLLQTNAAINPGNSGGGLFDANGNLIGIVVAKSTSTSSGTAVEGLGFAIPVNDIIDILEDLKTSGYVTGRPSLGVKLVNIGSSDSMFMYRVDREGTYVSELVEDSAAGKAGVQVGDCIIKIGDEEVLTSSDVKSKIAKYKAGDSVNVTVYRNGREITMNVILGEDVPSNIIGSNNFGS